MNSALTGLGVNRVGKLERLIFSRNVGVLTFVAAEFRRITVGLGDLLLVPRQFMLGLRHSVPNIAEIRKMRDDKQEIQHDEKQRSKRDDHALFKRTEIVPVAVHWTSERLSSRLKVQLAVAP